MVILNYSWQIFMGIYLFLLIIFDLSLLGTCLFNFYVFLTVWIDLLIHANLSNSGAYYRQWAKPKKQHIVSSACCSVHRFQNLRCRKSRKLKHESKWYWRKLINIYHMCLTKQSTQQDPYGACLNCLKPKQKKMVTKAQLHICIKIVNF